MPGEELPDPPIPDVPKYSPIAPARSTRRGATRTTVPTTSDGKPYTLPSLRPGDRVRILRLPSGTTLVPPRYGTVDSVETDPARYLVDGDDGDRGWYLPTYIEPIGSTVPRAAAKGARTSTTMTTFGLGPGDLVRVILGSTGAKHAGAIGEIRKFRPALSTGIRPVSVRLTEECPCPCDTDPGTDILVSEDRLERYVPPATKPFEVGQRVRIGAESKSDLLGEIGTITEVNPESSLPYTVEFAFPSRTTPAKSWFDGTELEHAPPRYLFLAIPLTDDPEEDPTDATEVIDLIAEKHEHIRFEAHDLEEPT